MSSKSDRDNRSNQLNPNNSAYHSSRGNSSRYGDDDECSIPSQDTSSYWSLRSNVPVISDVPYYIAAVTFEGSFIIAHFVVRAKEGHGVIARSVKDRVLAVLGDASELGVAYWRCACEWERGEFSWYEPGIKESELEACKKWMGPTKSAKANAWFAKSRPVAVNCENWFDWRKTEEAGALGVISQELPLTFSKHDYVNLDFNPLIKTAGL